VKVKEGRERDYSAYLQDVPVKLAKVAWMPAKLRPTPSPKLWLRQEERRAATTIS